MKKSLIALAVAGVFAAPVYAASGNVDVYGKVRMSVDHIDSKAANSDKWQVTDQVSRVGVKGSEDLGGGMKAVWQIEQQINATDPANPTSATTCAGATCPAGATYKTTNTGDSAFGGANLRNTFVGISGDFGTALIGRHDTPYKMAGSADLFADTLADSQKSGGIIGRQGFDNRWNNTIVYLSPTFGGFSGAVAIAPGEQTGVVAADGIADMYSLSATYKNGPIQVSAGYENQDADMLNAAGGTDKSAWKINGGFTIGDVKLGLTYEESDGCGGTTACAAGSKDDTAWLGSVAYGMGPITLALQYGQFDEDDTGSSKNKDLKRTVLGVFYNLSKRTNVYALYKDENFGRMAAGDTNFDIKAFSMGVNHDF